MIRTAEDYAKVVKACRALKGWSQQELADKAEVTRTTVQNIERGKMVTLTTMVKIQTALADVIDTIQL